MAAMTTSLPALLDSLASSLNSAVEAAPKSAALTPSNDGLSLLDVKNELLLSYLQNLVFLILLRIRNAQEDGPSHEDSESESKIAELVVKKLVELRLYLERGVRPLEEKLRYQIEKVLRAADDAERNAKAAEEAKQSRNPQADGSDSDSGSAGDDSEDEGDNDKSAGRRKLSDLQYRPNLASFVPAAGAAAASSSSKTTNTSGVYRPPRIAATVMPTTERRERVDRRTQKSATLDEFITDELSTAPTAEPSIGTTIVAGGRKVKTARERQVEDERREYEERNFVRLPKESKKDRLKNAKQAGRSSRMNFGGEEWRDIGEGVDRINRLTKARSNGSGTKALLEKSRKRGHDTTDGPLGSGNSHASNMGERYQKRLKVLEAGRRDRGKKR